MKKSYDVAIIGTGIAGLFAGAMLAKQKLKVIFIEKNNSMGGYFSAFQTEDGAVIDYGADYLLACGQGGEVFRIIEELGLTETISFKKLDYSDKILLKNKVFIFPKGWDKLCNALIEFSPDSKEEIKSFINWMKQFADAGEKKSSESGKFFMHYYKESYRDFIERTISDPELRTVLSVRIQGDPSSLMLMAGFISESYGNGMYYPIGGSGRICDALIEFIKKNGGDFITGQACKEFIYNENKVNKVITDKGNEYTAKYFIYNGDPFRLTSMLPEAFDKKMIEKRKIGHSSLSIFLIINNLDTATYNCGRIYICEDNNIFDAYHMLETGVLLDKPIIKVHIPTIHDKSLISGNRHIVRIETDVYHINGNITKEEYEKYAEKMIDIVDKKLVPDLKSKIVYKRIVSPIEFENMFLSKAGSGTGWLHNTENYMLSSFPSKSNYSNMYIAGQWGSQGSGIRQVALSAEKVSKEIIRKEKNRNEK